MHKFLLYRYLGGNFGVVLPPQTTVTSNRPFSLMIAIAPPVCPSEATSADAPTTAAPTRIFAELLLLSRRTLAFLLKDSRWLVTLTSRCQACTVPIRKGKSYLRFSPETNIHQSLIAVAHQPLLLQIQSREVDAFIEMPLISVGVAPRRSCRQNQLIIKIIEW